MRASHLMIFLALNKENNHHCILILVVSLRTGACTNFGTNFSKKIHGEGYKHACPLTSHSRCGYWNPLFGGGVSSRTGACTNFGTNFS